MKATVFFERERLQKFTWQEIMHSHVRLLVVVVAAAAAADDDDDDDIVV